MSEIRVENIIGETGTDAVKFTKGINVTGVTTATSFSGSGASLTSLPAANLTGTLPAISGANLTGISAGVSEIDHWIVNSNFNGSVNPITNNIVRYEQNGVTKLGTGMSYSSGIFTFPSTGYWRIIVHFQSIRNPAGHQCRYMQIRTVATTNNSSYEYIAIAENSYYDNYNTGSRHGGGHSEVIFDCQNTSTHKIKFESIVQDNSGSGAEFSCSSTIFLTGFAFVKIADT